MHSPTLRLPVIKGGDERFNNVLRWGLLVWAILRLIMSVLLTGTLIMGTIETIKHFQNRALKTTSSNYAHYKESLWLFVYAILVQLVEIGMLTTFVTAGITKNVKLYRAYYLYCFVTLVNYIIAVTLFVILVPILLYTELT